jgi:hypothetical protein
MPTVITARPKHIDAETWSKFDLDIRGHEAIFEFSDNGVGLVWDIYLRFATEEEAALFKLRYM